VTTVRKTQIYVAHLASN